MMDKDRSRPGSLSTGPIVILIGATLATGLTAGVFGDWAHTIMPGLRSTDDRTFVEVERALDAAILNPPFLLGFFGALVLTGVAAILCRRGVARSLLLPVVLAFGLLLAGIVITMAVHEPLNVVVRDAELSDPATVRAAFDETRWVAWHLVRTVVTTVAFGCLAWALVLTGRVQGATNRPAR